MPTQTRSRGVPSPSRIYNSTPTEKQVKFPTRRKVVRTYGKQQRRSTVEPTGGSSSGSLRQQTLTQIDFVSSFDGKDAIVLSDSEAEHDSDDNNDDKENRDTKRLNQDEEKDEEPVSSGRKRRATTKKVTTNKDNKRRRTIDHGTDDKVPKGEDNVSRRKTLGDAPTSSCYTQTLTQFLGRDNYIKDSDDEDDGFEEWLQKRSLHPPTQQQAPSSKKDSIENAPQTPSKRVHHEIPSSTCSSKLSTPVSKMIDRYGAPDSIAKSSPSSMRLTQSTMLITTELPGKPTPRLVIQDTYTSESWGSGGRTPHRDANVRVPLAEKTIESQTSFTLEGAMDETPTKPKRHVQSTELGDSSKKMTTPRKMKRVSPRKGAKVLFEIPDSDDEEDDEFENSDDGLETYAAGPETQFVLNELASSEEPSREVTPTPTTVCKAVSSPSSIKTACRSIPAVAKSSSQPTTRQVDSSPKQLPSSPPRPMAKRLRKPLHPPTHQSSPTQFHESQRVPLATLQSLPPAEARTDVLLPLPLDVIDSIIGGFQVDVAFSFKVPAQVVRFWLFDGAKLRYMACTEPATIADGVGWKSRLAQVYELNNPMKDTDMREEEWYAGDIGKYVYLPPAVVGQLLWNLRHAMFGEDTQEGGTPQALPQIDEQLHMQPASSISVSQQVEAQIKRDITHSTQFPPSDDLLVPSTPEDDVDEDDKENSAPPARTTNSFAAPRNVPSQASVRPSPAPLTSYRTSRLPPKPTAADSIIRPSQATTVSQVSTPDNSHRPVPPPPLLQSSSLIFNDASPACLSGRVDSYNGSGSGLATTITGGISSSQLLTRSQMLPDSLIRDDERVPLVIWESEEDQEL